MDTRKTNKDYLMLPLKINEVFTPRSSNVNLKIYVPRLDLETALLRSVEGSMHSLLFGESGNGKSWLYKKVLNENNIQYRIANCANASRNNSLTNEIKSVLVSSGTLQKISHSENKEASIKAIFAEGKLSTKTDYSIQLSEPLQQALAEFRKSIGQAPAVLVIDNLESIFKNDKLMDELADILILLDDERYAQYKIKFLIVGIPNGILEYFARTKNLESVSNRLEELPKVTGLNLPMVHTLLKNGLNNLLKFNISEPSLKLISNHVHNITMGVAQRVHEYCEKLAYLIQDSKAGFLDVHLNETDSKWLLVGMRQAYTVIESHLNSRRTTIARRNQVLYCIGKLKTHQINSAKIADHSCIEFPSQTTSTNMSIGSILTELASGESPLLQKNPKTNEYRVCDSRYIMCIRTMLVKDASSNTVLKRQFVH